MGMEMLKDRGVLVRIGGFVSWDERRPATGSMPIKAENFWVVLERPRARANAVLPPRLWPARATRDRLGRTDPGRLSSRFKRNQSATSPA